MSVEVFDDHEKLLKHRETVLEAELFRLSGAATFSVEDMRARLKEIYSGAEI